MKKLLSVMLCLLLVPGVVSGAFASITFSAEEEALLSVNLNAELGVHAKAYALMDVNTGTLLAASNENERLYPASVTKIMTLLLVCEAIRDGKLSPEETLVCSETAAKKGGSQIWLEPGEEMTVRDLLKAAVIYSANDACALLGETISGSEEAFVERMNERAAELGMRDTHFDNCTGLDDDTVTHLSTAYDIALMSRALISFDMIREYTTVWMDDLRGGKTQLVNTNRLIRYYPGATGLKTGTTSKAGCCVSATAERDGLGLIAVVLGASNSNDRFNGAKALLDYGFANYEIYTPTVDRAELPAVPVRHGEAQSVKLYADTAEAQLLSKGASARITQKTSALDETQAPVVRGQPLGTLELFDGDMLIASYALKAETDVPKLTFLSAFLRVFRSLTVQ